MIKIISLLFFVIFSLLIPKFSYALDIKINTNIVNQVINKIPITFKDQNYNHASHKFNGNGTVFIKFKAEVQGTEKNEVWLLGHDKEKIQRITLRRTEYHPYTYFGELTLPNKKGQYYLSINLKDANNSFSLEQNIEVVEIQKEENFSIDIFPTNTPMVTIGEEIKEENKIDIINLINKAINKIKSFLEDLTSR